VGVQVKLWAMNHGWTMVHEPWYEYVEIMIALWLSATMAQLVQQSQTMVSLPRWNHGLTMADEPRSRHSSITIA